MSRWTTDRPRRSRLEHAFNNSKIRGVVDMREKWVQELRDLKSVMVQWIPAHLNKADIMTKCFPNWIYQNRKKLITG